MRVSPGPDQATAEAVGRALEAERWPSVCGCQFLPRAAAHAHHQCWGSPGWLTQGATHEMRCACRGILPTPLPSSSPIFSLPFPFPPPSPPSPSFLHTLHSLIPFLLFPLPQPGSSSTTMIFGSLSENLLLTILQRLQELYSEITAGRADSNLATRCSANHRRTIIYIVPSIPLNPFPDYHPGLRMGLADCSCH